MKITAVRLSELTGEAAAEGQFRLELQDRLGRPVDIYPEYKAEGPPPPKPLFERNPANGKHIMRTGLLEIESDDGVTGLVTKVADTDAIRRMAPILLGGNPLATERLWDVIYRTMLSSTPGSVMHALAAVDIALWDLKCKALGQPLCVLLGGPVRDRVPAYAMMRDYSKDPEQAAEHCREIAGRGFRALKWYPRFGPTDGHEGVRRNLAFLRACRDAVGPDVDLIVDCWKTWNVPYTIDMARRLEEIRVRWIEEPVFQHKYEQYREIRQAVRSTCIAGGEQLYTLGEFKLLLDARGVDIVQPDPFWCGGVTPITKIIALAQAFDVQVVMHVVHVPVNIQISAALSPAVCPLIEYPTYHDQFVDQYFLKDPVKASGGEVAVAMRPALFEIDEAQVVDKRVLFSATL